MITYHVNPSELIISELVNVGDFIITANMGIVMLIGMILLANTKGGSKYNYLGAFCLVFSMGVSTATGVMLDILLLGAESNTNADFTKEHQVFFIFGTAIVLCSFYYFYKFIKTK